MNLKIQPTFTSTKINADEARRLIYRKWNCNNPYWDIPPEYSDLVRKDLFTLLGNMYKAFKKFFHNINK